MPSTVKMGRMPHNNKMKTSRTLETNNMWSKTIGHDPYHNAADQNNLSVQERHGGGESEEFKNLSRLVAKARGEESSAEARSGWKGKRPLKGLFSAGASAVCASSFSLRAVPGAADCGDGGGGAATESAACPEMAMRGTAST